MKLVIFFVILLILYIILYVILNNKYNINDIEKYENIIKTDKRSCPKIINKNNSFCVWAKHQKKCQCKYQKDSVDITFPVFPDCCKEDCSKKNENNCEDINKKPFPFYYWCVSENKCKKYRGFINKNNVSANNCGIGALTNQLLHPHYSEDECKKSISICNKFNDNSIDSKKKCLNNRLCGWCTNNSGLGKCIEGTPIGPIDYNKYSCRPNNKDGNSWQIGNPTSYII